MLCFIANKFGTFTPQVLKSSIMDFYSVKALADAKVRLLNDVSNINLSTKHPHIPLRRSGEGRLEHEAGDLLSLFTFIDEQKMFELLPKYVSSSPDNMPSLPLYDGDMHVLMALLKAMSGDFDQFRSTLAAIARDVRELQAWPRLPDSVQPLSAPQPVSTAPATNRPAPSTTQHNTATRRGIPAASSESETVSAVAAATIPGVQDWATMAASTPRNLGSRFAVLATDDEGDSADAQQFTVVERRRSVKRARQRSSPPQPPEHQQQQQPRTAARRAPTVFGKATTVTGSNIVAAKKFMRIRKVAVFCLDNLDVKCSVEDIRSFVSQLSVEVISCFEVKPRRRRHETTVTDRKAFRLCIHEEDCDKLLNEAVWPDSVTLSPWYYKEPNANANVNTANEHSRANVRDNANGDVGDAAARRSTSMETLHGDNPDAVVVDAAAAADDDEGASTASAATNNDAVMLQDEPTMSSDDTILTAYNIEDGSGN